MFPNYTTIRDKLIYFPCRPQNFAVHALLLHKATLILFTSCLQNDSKQPLGPGFTRAWRVIDEYKYPFIPCTLKATQRSESWAASLQKCFSTHSWIYKKKKRKEKSLNNIWLERVKNVNWKDYFKTTFRHFQRQQRNYTAPLQMITLGLCW